MFSSNPVQLIRWQDLHLERAAWHWQGSGQLLAGERVALLGRNGSGKSSFLQALSGHLAPVAGEIWQQPQLRLGYVSQHPTFGSEQRVADVIREANPLRALECELTRLEPQLDRSDVLAHWAQLEQRYSAEGGYLYPVRAQQLLDVLGLAGTAAQLACTLSGGQQTRLALAQGLLAQPDVLLLDEPTNHLDIAMREWLERYLCNQAAAVVFTSHDRYFIDQVAQRSVWFAEGSSQSYAGGYSHSYAVRAIEQKTKAKQAHLNQIEQQRLSGSALQLDRWGNASAGVKSRLKRLDVQPLPPDERNLQFQLSEGQAKDTLLVWGQDVTLQYPEHAQPVLQKLHFRVRAGDRIVLMAANGSGKSSLLQLLAGRIFAQSGDLRYSPAAQLAYFEQHGHGLHPKRTLAEQYTACWSHEHSLAMLHRYGLSALDALRYPSQLSGGQQARAGLLRLAALPADILLLDEPSNHLDIEALEALEQVLLNFKGAFILVSHDRRFAQRLANRWWSLEQGQLIEYSGLYQREQLDPARLLADEQLLSETNTLPCIRQIEAQEELLAEIEYQIKSTKSGREEGRLRARLHLERQTLYGLYAQEYGAICYDRSVMQGFWRVCAEQRGEHWSFWVAQAPECSQLQYHYSDQILHWQQPQLSLPWFKETLLLGALRILYRLGLTVKDVDLTRFQDILT